MSKITARSGLTATINRDGSSKALESIIIEYDPAIAGIIDDDTFYDKLAYKVYDELSTEEVNDSYDVEFRQELNVLIWTITPGSDKSYTDLWTDLYDAIVNAPVDADDDEDPDDEGEDPDDEDPDDEEDDPKDKDDEDEPKKSDPKKDPPKKDSSKGQPKKDDSKKDPPKKDKPKKKTPPKKDANGTYYDTDDDRYHSDDADIEEGLDEFYTLFHASL